MIIVYYLYVEGDDIPFYVGKTNRKRQRLNEHLSESKNSNTIKCNIIKQAISSGKRIFLKTVCEVKTDEEACAIEKALISLHGRRDIKTGILANHTDGGEGVTNVVFTDETKKKMSEAKKGNKINLGRSRPDMVENFSKSISMYDENGNWIRSFSSARDAERETGIDFRSISNTLRGRIFRTKKNDKYYTFRYGTDIVNVEPFGGKKKMPNRRVRVEQYSLDGKHINSFNSISEAEKETGVSGISQCINGKLKRAGKFKWTKTNNED